MRVTREKAAENRANVVATAARLFREHGFDGIGLDAIMAEAGLTHGGFYRHFGSKEGLAAEAVAHAAAMGERLLADAPTQAAFVARYLSAAHRDDAGNGCMLAALGAEISRQGDAPRQKLTAHVRMQIDRLAGWLTGRNAAARREQAITTLAGMVGALVLSRAVEDPKLSEEILAAGRAVYGSGASATS